MSRQIPTTVLMRGGVDLETPLIASKPGSLLLAVNYEPTDRGYRRFAGYERYDGTVLPHQTTYALLRFTNGSVAIEAGDTVEGGTSGNEGVAVLDATVESGRYSAGDAAGYVILSRSNPFATIGPFVDGEDLEVSASKVAEADGAAQVRAASASAISSPSALGLTNRLNNAEFFRGTDFWTLTGATSGYESGRCAASSPHSGPTEFERPLFIRRLAGELDTIASFVGAQTAAPAASTLWGIDVTPGEQVEVSANVGTDGNCLGRLRIQFRSAANAVVSQALSATSSGFTPGDPSSNARLWVSATVPAGAARAVFVFDNFSPVTTALESLATLFRPQTLYPAPTGTTEPQPYVPSTRLSPDQTLLQATADYWRETIAKPSGSDAIRGVHYYTDYSTYGSVICFRDNAGGTAGQMFDNFAGTGWASITLRHTLGFTANTVGQFAVGQTVTGGSSGATGIIQAVVRQSGTWGTDAAGYLVLASISGTFVGETITAPGVSATSTGTQAAITLPPGGRYRFVNENVRATVDLKRMYFANGEGYAHEVYWNGSVLVVTPIRVPGLTAATDKPTHVAVFKNHLFLFYRNGVIRNSGIETPLEFVANGGAAEHGFGDEITDVVVSSSALIVFGRRKISYFTGSSAADFQLIPISADTGASPDSAQMVDTPYYFDGQMIRKLTTVDALGGWKMGAVAPETAEYWRAQVKAGARVVCSYRVQRRNQYVFVLSSGVYAVVYLGRKRAEVGFLQGLFFTPTCSTEIDHTEGLFTEDTVLLGGDDGHVYLMDVGRSFDGAVNEAYFLMSPISVAGVRRNHRWHKAKVSIVPEGLVTTEPLTLRYAGLYSFATNVTPYQASQVARDDLGTPSGLPGGLAGLAQFLSGNEATIDLDGFGHNIAMLFVEGQWEGTPAYTIDSITFYTTPRRQEG